MEDRAIKESLLESNEWFGFIRLDPTDSTILTIKFDTPEIAKKSQRFYNGRVIDGIKISASMLVDTFRANRAGVFAGRVSRPGIWARRAGSGTPGSLIDAASVNSGVTDDMSTVSGL